MINEAKIKDAEDFAQKHAGKITTTQIRKFLSALNKLENKASSGKFDKSEVKYLKVKLAYQVGKSEKVKDRNGNYGFVLMPLYDKLKQEIDRIDNVDDFRDFARYVEAIVAYFKFSGRDR